MDIEKLIYLLKEFSEGYCDKGENIENCNNCELNKKGLCETVNLVSRYLNNEITEDRMIKEINFDYRMRKFNE